MASVLKYIVKEAFPFHKNEKRYGREENSATVATYSRTVYVGNIGYCTTDRQIYEFFSRVGPVEVVHMGLNRINLTPCGFCFVVFRRRSSVIQAVNYLNGMILDGSVIRIDVDKGFKEHRRFGRGAQGGQPQDEIRQHFDRRRPVAKSELDGGDGGGDDAGDGADDIGFNFSSYASRGDGRGDDRGRDSDRRPSRGGRGNDSRNLRGGGGGRDRTWQRRDDRDRDRDRRPDRDFRDGGGRDRGVGMRGRSRSRSPPRRRYRSRSPS